jgi:hypothetical protein
VLDIGRNTQEVDWTQAKISHQLSRNARDYASLLTEFFGKGNSVREVSRKAISDKTELVSTPTLGCFQPGYSLAIPNRFIHSFAELGGEELEASERTVESWRSKLEEIFGDTIIAEHGSCGSSTLTAACVDHAHLHLLPLPGLRDAIRSCYYEAGGEPDACLSSLRELPEVVHDEPYVLLSTTSGEYEVWREIMDFRGQFVRRKSAELLGIPNLFNWRNHPFVDQLELSTTLLKPLFQDFDDGDPTLQRLFEWKTEYDAGVIHPDYNPHAVIFFERDPEKLLFFSACKAHGIAEEGLDGLSRLHEANALNDELRIRARAAACNAFRNRVGTCTNRAAIDLLAKLGTEPRVLEEMREDIEVY